MGEVNERQYPNVAPTINYSIDGSRHRLEPSQPFCNEPLTVFRTLPDRNNGETEEVTCDS